MGECGFGDVFFHAADGDRAEFFIQGTSAFAQAVLWADAAAHFGQAVGRVRQFSRFNDATFVSQAQPIGDVVVQRAFVLAIRVTTAQTAVGLRGRLGGGEALVDFHKRAGARRQRFFRWVYPR